MAPDPRRQIIAAPPGSWRWPLVALVAIVAGAIALAGCHRQPARFAVAGHVRLDDQPLDQAVIVFVPVDATRARKTGSEIVAGAYSIAARDGVSAGPHRVEISTYVGPHFAGGSHDEARRSLPVKSVRQVPEHYNARSGLQVEIKSVEPQEIDFELFTSDPQRTVVRHDIAPPSR